MKKIIFLTTIALIGNFKASFGAADETRPTEIPSTLKPIIIPPTPVSSPVISSHRRLPSVGKELSSEDVCVLLQEFIPADRSPLKVIPESPGSPGSTGAAARSSKSVELLRKSPEASEKFSRPELSMTEKDFIEFMIGQKMLIKQQKKMINHLLGRIKDFSFAGSGFGSDEE